MLQPIHFIKSNHDLEDALGINSRKRTDNAISKRKRDNRATYGLQIMLNTGQKTKKMRKHELHKKNE